MGITASSVASAVAAKAVNKQFGTSARNVDRKILIIGTALASATGYTADTPVQVYSAEDAGARFGFGSEIHRVAVQVFRGSENGIAVYVAPQAEAGAGVKATGTFAIGGAPTEAGYLNVYIAGELYQISVTTTDTPTTLGDALVAAMAADTGCPLVGVNTTGSVAMTAKAKGTYYNDVNMSVNWGVNEETPAGVTITVTPMASGATDPSVGSVFTAIGGGDLSNAENFTDVICCYGRLVAGTLNAISTYNGTGNLNEGCYADTVFRPFRALAGDVTAGSGGLTAVLAVANGRKTDRTNGAISVPGSPNHPQEIAGLALGIMAITNQNRAAEHYVGKLLPGIIPGAKADQWTKDYSSRDTAAKAGVSPTEVRNGAVYMTNVLTFYHPDDVPTASNGYRSQRNISILQNVLYNVGANFKGEKWQGISIVADIAKVSNATDRAKARDLGDVRSDLFALADQFESRAWIFSAAFTKEKISSGGYITIRGDGLGFDVALPILFSGEGGIFNNEVQFDTNLSIVLN